MAIPFLHKMAVHSSLPLLLVITVALARLPAYYLRKKYRKHQKALMIKILSSLSLVLYPGLCTRLFASLKVVTVDGLQSEDHTGKVLAVDYSVEAFGDAHHPFIILCFSCMVLFVIGIPLIILWALWSNRKYLYSAGTTEEDRQRHHDAVDEFGTLYLQCKFDFGSKFW